MTGVDLRNGVKAKHEMAANDRSREIGRGASLVEVSRLTFWYGTALVLEDVSFEVRQGEFLSIIGASGCGKSTLLQLLDGILKPTEGTVFVRGRRADGHRDNTRAMVFQNFALFPWKTVLDNVRLGLDYRRRDLSGRERTQIARHYIERVGLTAAERLYPHQLSGGMRQRVMIAMALACRPRVLIADEPTTALDVTIQAEILDLLRRLQQETGMSMIFITHNLGIVAQIADRVMVMYSGQVVEESPTSALLGRRLMPYTAGLLRSLPRLEATFESDRRLSAIPGNVPDPRSRPSGWVFHPRCEHALETCKKHRPALEQIAPAHLMRCARWREIAT